MTGETQDQGPAPGAPARKKAGLGCLAGLAVVWVFVSLLVVSIFPALKILAAPAFCRAEDSGLVVTEATSSYNSSTGGASTRLESDLYCVDADRRAYLQPWPEVTLVLALESLVLLAVVFGLFALRRLLRGPRDEAAA